MTEKCTKCGGVGRKRSSLGRVLCFSCYDKHIYNTHWFLRSLKWTATKAGKVKHNTPLPGQRTLFS